jgi:hypothetical protein
MNRLGSLEIRKNRVITASTMVTTAGDLRPALPPPLPFDGLFSDESLASCLDHAAGRPPQPKRRCMFLCRST